MTCVYEVDGCYLSAMGVLARKVRLKDARLVRSQELANLESSQLFAIDARDAQDLAIAHSLAQTEHLFAGDEDP